ncbi:MAG: tRNA (adenosine(37)-N6)-dimethylallyltransferase MiaA [Candidatus Eisenbacteria bacterium]|uniref:tRNA dimethylallyltransferase n=1 Tax=Eiseniibacteriota bacterium TaxID=2212470 RepID=A0A938BP12_UNCEI|nr:tRNA (adenosine(37)-N6)-dimethylallyltransferase MiaA [Candidatus Eisenbacteria bacterium]
MAEQALGRPGPGRTTLPEVFLVGPTAVGKTAVAIELALALGAEILSIDSRQAYRRLDIGTAKPTPDEQARVRHHLLDLCEPTETLSAEDFARSYRAVREDLARRGAAALATGGSGLYVDACLGRLDPLPPADAAIRAAHEELRRRLGPEALHALLVAVDPASAARLHPRDFKRVSRALEVHETSGRPLSELRTRADPLDVSRDPRLLLLLRAPADLDARIEARSAAMLAAGLLAEVRGLLESGVPAGAPGLEAIGYGDFAEVLRGALPLPAALERFARRTRQYARRQKGWFRNRYRGVTEVAIAPGEAPAETAGRCLDLLGIRERA